MLIATSGATQEVNGSLGCLFDVRGISVSELNRSRMSSVKQGDVVRRSCHLTMQNGTVHSLAFVPMVQESARTHEGVVA